MQTMLAKYGHLMNVNQRYELGTVKNSKQSESWDVKNTIEHYLHIPFSYLEILFRPSEWYIIWCLFGSAAPFSFNSFTNFWRLIRSLRLNGPIWRNEDSFVALSVLLAVCFSEYLINRVRAVDLETYWSRHAGLALTDSATRTLLYEVSLPISPTVAYYVVLDFLLFLRHSKYNNAFAPVLPISYFPRCRHDFSSSSAAEQLSRKTDE